MVCVWQHLKQILAIEVPQQQSKSMSAVFKSICHISSASTTHTQVGEREIEVSTSSQWMTVLGESGTGEEARRQFQNGHRLIQDTNHGLPKIVVRMDEIWYTSWQEVQKVGNWVSCHSMRSHIMLTPGYGRSQFRATPLWGVGSLDFLIR